MENKLDAVVEAVPLKPFYRDERTVIYNADCREVLPHLPKSDLLLTDPPYGIGVAKRGTIGTSKCGEVKDYGKSDWDNAPPDGWTITAITNSAVHGIIWGGNYFTLHPSPCWLVWDKDNTGDFADCELAWTNFNKAVRKFRWRWNGMLQERAGDKKEIRVHPTQKLVPLMQWCLGFAPDAETILDPYMGSGTSLVAAKLEGRYAVGIEISEDYCRKAAERLRQGVLF